MPIIEGAHLRGVLAADRDAPFTEADRDLLADASAQVLRVVQAEQVFRAVERAKYEHERFYQATAMLGRALTPEQVMETAFDAAAAIVEYDAAAIALYDKDRATPPHRRGARRAPGGEGIVDPSSSPGLEFKDNAGLASMVVKNRHYLPAGGEPREVSAPIYTRKVKIDDAKSLLVLPLLVRRRGDRHAHARRARREAVRQGRARDARGDREPGRGLARRTASSTRRWRRWRRPTASPVSPTTARSSSASTTCSSARSATTTRSRCCCATSTTSRRSTTTTATRSATRCCAASRACCRKCRARSTSRRATAARSSRSLLDNVDVAQAKAVAERIRIEIAKVVVETEKGPLSVTESIGVAAFPDDGRDRATLIERADLALYHAKHTGRNRVVTWAEAQAAKAKKAS